jgi:hypothetical protein
VVDWRCGIQVFDVSSPGNPVHLGTAVVQGVTTSITAGAGFLLAGLGRGGLVTLPMQCAATAVDPGPIAVAGLLPVRIFPNPGLGRVALRVDAPEVDVRRITVYDIRGHQVRDLVQDGSASGRHVFSWDGRDESGHPAPAGVYFARVVARGAAATARIVLLR